MRTKSESSSEISPFPGSENQNAASLREEKKNKKVGKMALVRRVPLTLVINYSFSQKSTHESCNPKVTNIALGKTGIAFLTDD